jgi:fermentation-respiration switch protein FrsA (DUF1100 family)
MVLWIAVATVVLVLVLLWWQQGRLIYFPSQAVPPAATTLPGAQEVAFVNVDGLRLNGWFLTAAGEARGPTVLVLNGNGGNRAHRAPLAEALAREGFGVLLFDYRGYGGNPGTPSEAGLLADARAARAYLLARDDIDPTRLVYLGESLGAAVAVALAAEAPPWALVLRSPFTSLTDVGKLHYPLLPVGPLLRDRYPSIDRIGAVAAPVLVVAGERDELIPAEQSQRLYTAAPEPKRFVLIAGAGHNDYAFLAGSEFIGAVVRFLNGVAAP